MPSISAKDLKRLLLELVEGDRELRYALMGLLGFREVLERITRLEERQQKLEERFARLEERFAGLAERQQRLEERFAKLEERFAQLEERVVKLEERVAKLEERFAELEERVVKLEERFVQLEERVARLEERMLRVEERLERLEEVVVKHGELIEALAREVKRLGSSVGALGRRFGKGFEALVREGYRDLLRGLGLSEYDVQRLRYVDIDGRYLAPGTVIEVDMVVRDNQLWLLELKSYVDEDDVSWFNIVSRAAEKILGRRADRRIILGVVVEREAYDYARKLGIDVIYVNLAED